MARSLKSIALLLLMLAAAALAAALRPTISLADERPPVNLGAMVPTRFGDWTEQLHIATQIVNPQQRQVLEQIYSQTLTRTYVHTSGYRIMLSIAYGKNQSDALQLHKPEICYPAQGFTLLAKRPSQFTTPYQSLRTTQLETSLGSRQEPVTYWTVIGDEIAKSSMDKKMIEIRYALKDRIPDGMLVRVSSIDRVTANAYRFQTQFAVDMIHAIAPEHRSRFAGMSAVQSTDQLTH